MSQPPAVSVPNVCFASTACFNCLRSPPGVPALKRCSGCKRVKFCSTTCSKAAWPTHKLFCTSFATLRRRPHAYLPPLYDLTSASSIHDRRETHRAQWLLEDDLLDAGMGSNGSGSEGQLLWREPRCAVCWDREGDVERREGEEGVKAADGWKEEVKGEGEVEENKTKGWRTCPDCAVVPWCGSVHEDMDRAKHSKVVGPYGFTQCQTIQLSNEIDEFHLRHSLASPGQPPKAWMPSRLLPPSSTPSIPSPTTWAAYLSPHLASFPTPKPTSAEIYGVWLEGLSPVLTSHAALTRTSFSRKSLDIHIIETAATGPHQRALFEELLHLLPSVVELRLHFFPAPLPSDELSPPPSTTPPTTEPQKTCGPCSALHRTRTHIVHTTPYSTFAASLSPTSAPSLVLALDPSLSASLPNSSKSDSSDSSEPDAETWATILDLVASKKWTGIFTATTQKDTKDDWETAKGVVGRDAVMGSVERNAWAGGWPKVDMWEEEGVWRAAGWVWSLN
ncbi:hypothetical protein RQP46_008546 [Phenoliferia psychrophenolica]